MLDSSIPNTYTVHFDLVSYQKVFIRPNHYLQFFWYFLIIIRWFSHDSVRGWQLMVNRREERRKQMKCDSRGFRSCSRDCAPGSTNDSYGFFTSWIALHHTFILLLLFLLLGHQTIDTLSIPLSNTPGHLLKNLRANWRRLIHKRHWRRASGSEASRWD